ncbi:hypothetical protein DDB_G0278363 [Dictyostelium discoideum AX4]|uniref:Uncharacterized protein n=1 Tax=Dictyostelium discoideum TaxID=44689 RepID=Q54Y87_DICDI|nr:hypothetical protein DDB_G0278363 [Dictyostelium discoideum AX4]EAL68354.1 hypothetical protein DDB_G0278363 [Dictyostelium discoideum AX4]|eukprot:XP_642315.1 hypothetical protein DDB_G0278363 [Dictyostelium discoideum AX4]
MFLHCSSDAAKKRVRPSDYKYIPEHSRNDIANILERAIASEEENLEKIEKTKERLSRARKEIEDLNARNESIQELISENDKNLKNTKEEIERLKKEKDELKKAKGEFEASLKEIEVKTAFLEDVSQHIFKEALRDPAVMWGKLTYGGVIPTSEENRQFYLNLVQHFEKKNYRISELREELESFPINKLLEKLHIGDSKTEETTDCIVPESSAIVPPQPITPTTPIITEFEKDN